MKHTSTVDRDRGRKNIVWAIALGCQAILTSTQWLMICLGRDLTGGDEWIAVLFFCALVWQCLMLGFWAGLGTTKWRIPSIALGTPLLGILSSYALEGALWELQLFCLSIMSVAALTSGLLRFRYGRLRRESGHLNRSQDGLQFGIRQVLVWTGIAGGLFAAGRFFVAELSNLFSDLDTVAEILVLAVCLSMSMVLLVWTLLGVQIKPARILTVVLVAALGAAGIYTFSHGQTLFLWTLLFCHLQVALSFFLMRRMGYRFVGKQLPSSEGGL